MGRRKVELKKIENNTYRHISFSKRKTGLVKKAYELSTMCDTEVGLVLFSPAGKLFLYEGKKRIEDTLQQYMDLPERQRGRVNNPELIRGIIAQLALEWNIYKKEKLGYASSCMDMESLVQGLMNDINACGSQLEEVKNQLMCLVENASLVQESTEAGEHEEILEWVLGLVRMRKQVIEENEHFRLQQGLAHEFPTNGGSHMGQSSSYSDLLNKFPIPTTGGFDVGENSSYNNLSRKFSIPTPGGFDVGKNSNYNDLSRRFSIPTAGRFDVGESSNYNDLSRKFSSPTTGGFDVGESSNYNGLSRRFSIPTTGGFDVGESSNYNDLSSRFPILTSGGFDVRASSNYNDLSRKFLIPITGGFEEGASSNYNGIDNAPPLNLFDVNLRENQPFLGGNFNPPTQPEPNFPSIPKHSSFDFGFQPFSNETQNYAGHLQQPQTGLQEMSVDFGPINGPNPFAAFTDPQPEFGLADVNFPSTVGFPPDAKLINLPNDQANASSNAKQSNVGETPLCSFGACEHSECGVPFGF